MSDISKIIIPGGDDYNIKDGFSISNITRSGDTFTATRRNGTSFTFTQGHQDISGKLNTSLKGANNGLAELDANGKVPTSQLPSYVDDVIEANGTTNFPSTGETGKIYVDTSTNKTYRWSGTTYTEISASLALGTTSSTAFRGDYGNSAYAHAVTNKGAAFSSGLYKITTNAEGHVTAATAVAKADITGLGIPGSDTNTHRPIQVNGTEVLGNNTTALNLKAGSNVTVTNSSGTVTIAATDTTYTSKAAASGGTDVSLVTTGEKATWNAKTSNAGTITGITMNGSSKGTSGVVDLGTVITAHQDISGKADKSATVSTVAWDSTNKKLTKTINGTTSDVVTGATILGGLTKAQVTTALGYTPPTSDTNTTYSSGTGLSLSGTTFNHSNSVTAQTTQAIYPIEIDSEGHISAYGSAVTPLTSHQTIKQDGVTGATINRYGICNTGANVQAKTASITNGTISLQSGTTVYIKFTNSNTASNPTLSINNSTAKYIMRYGTTPAGTTPPASWTAGAIVPLTYDGSNWIMNSTWDNNTAYSVMSVEEGTTGTATYSRVLSAANLKAIIDDSIDDRPFVTIGDFTSELSDVVRDSDLSDVVRDSDLSDGAYVNAPRYVNLGSISTLPGTWDVTGITTDMVCSQAILSNPAAQTGDWTVNTNTAGQITLSGTISGTTTVTLVMVPSISITGVKK